MEAMEFHNKLYTYSVENIYVLIHKTKEYSLITFGSYIQPFFILLYLDILVLYHFVICII